jgi:hypothetical protein
VNDGFKRICKEAVIAYSKVLSQQFFRGTEEDYKNSCQNNFTGSRFEGRTS